MHTSSLGHNLSSTECSKDIMLCEVRYLSTLGACEMIKKIISGGQTGADQGGLCAGKFLGLETGGTAPPNFMTHDGPNFELLHDIYGLTEGEPDPKVYPKRTCANVQDSDGTVLFGRAGSPGSRLTRTLCLAMGRPLLVNPDVRQLRTFIERNFIQVLNVAGNREHKNPGIHDRVFNVLVETFDDTQCD